MNKIPPAIYLLFPIAHLSIILAGPLGLKYNSYWGVNLLMAAWIITLVGAVLYIVHAVKNLDLNRERKTSWILALLLTGLVGQLFYWFKFVRSKAIS